MNQSVGHVFQGRFKSETIESDTALLNVIRYVHNKPVKAGLVKKPEEYHWSSYKHYLAGNATATIAFIWKLFDEQAWKFKEFHQKEDKSIFLDTKEELERIRGNKAQEAIGELCNKYGVVAYTEILNRTDVLEELVKEVRNRRGLLGRQIARLIGVSEAAVQRAFQR